MVNYLTTLLLEAVYQYLVPILWPETDNLLFLNRGRGNKFSNKNVPNARVDRGTACIRGGNATDQATMPSEGCCA